MIKNESYFAKKGNKTTTKKKKKKKKTKNLGVPLQQFYNSYLKTTKQYRKNTRTTHKSKKQFKQ